ncbi:FeoB small GTPase domain-containing protein [Halorubrum ezzemoulense]|nr:GTPase [Halorubrum ezzemoulense]MDB2265582.1 FeoB small GTPase domain-containing protein [Halorubrum ezzemoulense]MDB2276023.1 FeoB small GTPase domain-containing protein [Halorubrum ezzemoulense]MDB9302571.1 FeoB small GTPase domain-containing protein [Halorubrum ezzemoulense]
MTDARNVTDNVPSTENDGKETVVVVGKESVGKSELVAGLSGAMPTTGNVRGSTVDVERYESDETGDVLAIRYITEE